MHPSAQYPSSTTSSSSTIYHGRARRVLIIASGVLLFNLTLDILLYPKTGSDHHQPLLAKVNHSLPTIASHTLQHPDLCSTDWSLNMTKLLEWNGFALSTAGFD